MISKSLFLSCATAFLVFTISVNSAPTDSGKLSRQYAKKFFDISVDTSNAPAPIKYDEINNEEGNSLDDENDDDEFFYLNANDFARLDKEIEENEQSKPPRKNKFAPKSAMPTIPEEEVFTDIDDDSYEFDADAIKNDDPFGYGLYDWGEEAETNANGLNLSRKAISRN